MVSFKNVTGKERRERWQDSSMRYGVSRMKLPHMCWNGLRSCDEPGVARLHVVDSGAEMGWLSWKAHERLVGEGCDLRLENEVPQLRTAESGERDVLGCVKTDMIMMNNTD